MELPDLRPPAPLWRESADVGADARIEVLYRMRNSAADQPILEVVLTDAGARGSRTGRTAGRVQWSRPAC